MDRILAATERVPQTGTIFEICKIIIIYKKLQKEAQDRQQAIFQQIGPKYQKVIQDLIEIEGYDLIMDRNSLIYANSKHEITRKITEKLNENRQ